MVRGRDAVVTYDPSAPVPPDMGAHHTHRSDDIEVSASRQRAGHWWILVKLRPLEPVEAGHVVAAMLDPEGARAVAQWLVQAAGDLERGRLDAVDEPAP